MKIELFERVNKIPINIFGLEEKDDEATYSRDSANAFPIYITKLIKNDYKPKEVCSMLYFKEHYVLVTI